MTTVRAPSGAAISNRGAAVRPVLRLAATEGRRILLHPVHLLFGAALVAIIGISTDPRTLFGDAATIAEGLEYIFLLYYGLVVFFAANLVASSPCRSGAGSQLAATPVAGQRRTAALCLGALAPAAVAGLVAALILQLSRASAIYQAPSAAEVAVLPLCALGAALLGIAVSQWLPWPVVPLGVMVVVVFWVGFVQGKASWAWSAPWTASHKFVDDPTLLGGSQGWHAVYLAGLATLAALAALLRREANRRRLLLVAGLIATGTVVAGTLQLP